MTTTLDNPHRLSAVVFDWAGTVLDFGSCAPMGAFVRLFEQFGIRLSIEQARGPMGVAKWDHIKALSLLPEVAAVWERRHGKPFVNADTDLLYEVFTPMNAAVGLLEIVLMRVLPRRCGTRAARVSARGAFSPRR